MEDKELHIKIVVHSIDVDSDGYFSFKYDWTKNDGRKIKGFYSNDFEGQTAAEWKRSLLNGEALRLALQQIAEAF